MASFAKYAKEFENPLKNCLIKPNKLAKTEMIAPQLDDPFIEDLEEQVAKIYSVVEYEKIRDNETLFRHNVVVSAVKTINMLVYERFGIRLNMLFAEGAFFACLPCPPKAYNELNRNLLSTVRTVKRDLKKYENSFPHEYDKADNKKNNELLYSNGSDSSGLDAVVIKYIENIESITKVMKTDGIVVDTKKAKIHGLPDDYKVSMLADFRAFYVFDLSVREVVAIMMHELGHLFTHIEYSYRQVDATAVLLDTLHTNIKQKNKNYKEALKIAFEYATGNKLDEKFKSLDTVPATVYAITNFDKSIVESSVHSFTDSEQLADQFATQFGLGTELTSALSKLNRTSTDILYMSIYFYRTSKAMLCIILVMGIILMLLGFGLVALGVAALLTIFNVLLTYVLNFLFRRSYTTFEMTYDEIKRRLHRIRNDAIRIIRTSNLEKEASEALLYQIDYIAEEMENVTNERKSIIEKVLISFSKHFNNLHNVKTTERLLEDLQENNLHVAAEKIKNFNK